MNPVDWVRLCMAVKKNVTSYLLCYLHQAGCRSPAPPVRSGGPTYRVGTPPYAIFEPQEEWSWKTNILWKRSGATRKSMRVSELGSPVFVFLGLQQSRSLQGQFGAGEGEVHGVSEGNDYPHVTIHLRLSTQLKNIRRHSFIFMVFP